jgi:hypothetical protein
MKPRVYEHEDKGSAENESHLKFPFGVDDRLWPLVFIM